jgi:hypothetical protein
MSFGHPQELLAIIKGFHLLQAWHLGSPEQSLERAPALGQWHWAEVLAV